MARLLQLDPAARSPRPAVSTFWNAPGGRSWRVFGTATFTLSNEKWADVSTIPAPELAGQLQDMLTRYGFTTVFDTGSKWENTRRLRERIESGEIAGPRIYSTGEIIFAKGGAPEQRILDVVGTMRLGFPEVSNPVEASAAARKLSTKVWTVLRSTRQV